ncbi:MAG TPA: MlaD family protein [Solirubrobacteraceae bacterium]|jgi:virulence factor Mce-like protein
MRRLLVIGLVLAAGVVIAVLGTGAGDSGGGNYKVRVIFDNAFSIIEGEDVRVSGVNVGKIEKLEVTRDNKAAAVLSITEPDFQDFRSDAKCTIRPQSLIGEKYVECTLTEPRPNGGEAPAKLGKVPDGEDGAGQYLLPVDRTSKPVDTDLINNVLRLPQRQRLAVILNELGAALAGRQEDLNETIRRANPALAATNDVLKILAEQNDVLARLATDSDRVLAPLARDRRQVADFIVQANTVSRATAAKRTEFERGFELLPRFLEELRPTMDRLGELSDEMSPVLEDLQAQAPNINRFFKALGPFSTASIPAFESLGEAAAAGRPALLAAKPIIDDLRRLTGEARPLADNLAKFTISLRETGGIERILDYLFYQAAALNGFDSFGHYLRAGLIVNTCSTYSTTPQPGCSAHWRTAEEGNARAATLNPNNIRTAFMGKAGEDHSAQALRAKDNAGAADGSKARGGRGGRSRRGSARGRRPALQLPSAVLPGQDASPPAQQPQDQPTPADGGNATQTQEGLLDYLLGGGA